MIGQVIGNTYQILEKLGQGGMGSVFKGVDLNLQRPVAIKVLREDLTNNPALVERFRSEAITLAKLNHPNIATLYSFLPHGNQYFMVMEYVPGETLEHLIRQRGVIPYLEAIPLFCQALEGIGQAHRMGIIHRDIKPANLMVVDDLGEKRVKVMDFGIARVLGTSHLTNPGKQVGTLHYMSPEQAEARELDTRSDIYSLGIVLFEMLTGRIPFDADSEYLLCKMHIEQPPPSPRLINPNIPPAIEEAVLKAMAKSPAARFQNAGEFRAYLLNQIGIPVVSLSSIPNISNVSAIKETRVETASQSNAQPAIPIPIPTPVPTPIPKPSTEGDFLKQNFVKIAVASSVFVVLIITVIIAGKVINFNNITSSPTPTSELKVYIPLLKSRPVGKEELLKVIRENPKAFGQIGKEVEESKVNFELTLADEQEFVSFGATKELITSIRNSYLKGETTSVLTPTPQPSISPASNQTPGGGFPGGSDVSDGGGKPKVVAPPPIIEPTPTNEDNSVKKTSDTSKNTETKTTDSRPVTIIKKPTPKPTVDPEIKLKRIEFLKNRRKQLLDQFSEESDPVKKKAIQEEAEKLKRELDNLK